MTAQLHTQILTLRKYQAWRTGEDERTMDEAGIVPSAITSAIDGVLDFAENHFRDATKKVATQSCNMQPSESVKVPSVEAMAVINLALEYWADRQQRYKNRAPVWVTEARALLARYGQPATYSAGYTLGPISDGGMDPRNANANDRQARGEPVAWYTDDHLTDKSATTWDRTIAARWRDKGWPAGELFATPQPQQIPEGYRLQPLSEFDAMMDTRTIPEGYKLVPTEPTMEMLLAGDAEFGKRKIPSISGICYKAMLAAASKGAN